MFKIGNIEIDNNIVLAPMAGICNSAFRRICKEMGVGLIYAEMVSDKALVYNSKKTSDMLYTTDYERPIAQQIFGNDKDSFVKAARIVYDKMKPDIIDINMGCPVPKIAIRSQAGAALLKNPDKIYEIVKAVVNEVPIPVTVKIRSGWDSNSINAINVAKICEKAGASAITIHGRTRAQGYSGKVDYDVIRDVKRSVSIPVIGNGDIVDIESAKKMFDTGVDAIMIGRGVLGNPWLIRDIVNYFVKGINPFNVSYEEKIEMCFKHLDYLMEIKPEKVAVMEMRSHIAWYIKGMPDSVNIKVKCFKAITAKEIKSILREYIDSLNDRGDRMKNIVRKRIVAYFIDILIVSFFVGLIINSNHINSSNDYSKKLNSIVNDYSSEKISTQEYLDEYFDIIYEINQDSFNENVLYLIICIVYFLVFQYLNEGSTIGKKIMKIRIVNEDKKRVSFGQLLIRVGLINQVFSMILLIIITKILSGFSFFVGYGMVSIIRSFIFIICVVMLFFDKNNIALHDKISNSQVIYDE